MGRGTALITGSSSGIGEAFARLLAREGFDLVLTARREEKLLNLTKELTGVRADVIAADLSHPEGIEKLLLTIDEKKLDINLAINNAGMMVEKPLHRLTNQEIDNILALNISAIVKITRHLIEKMARRGHGRILNVASVAAFHPFPGMDIYSATKAFVLSLSESLAENHRSQGIFVTALCPGITDTEMAEKNIIDSVPNFMIARPEQVAREGYDAVMGREVVRISGLANRLALGLAKHQPRSLIRKLSGLATRFVSR
ncbi:MAG: hypothetical protein CMQ40_09545 [Gammaproteobacteria bacterium]|nr:hypothetical protein [Gammaproteobacteria bacterium]|tara:strand:+ start:486 stop:1256 length:771 start_codon:yes stop_codon:yes gene_type:complete